MRIRRSLATSTTFAATTSSDPDHRHHSDSDNLLQSPRRCNNNNNNNFSSTTTKTRSVIICVLNQSPWDVTDLSSLQLDGGLFSLTGTAAPVFQELTIGSQSFVSSGKLCVEETTQPLLPEDALDKCLNRRHNAQSGGLSLPQVKIRAEENSTGNKVASSNKPQIRASSNVKKQQMAESSDVAPKSGINHRGRTIKKSAANPNEFYYYSGFGPHWGKKRETVTKQPVVASKVVESNQELRKSTERSTKRDIEFVDYEDDDDNDDDEDDINGEENEGARRPRGRKRMKARSLKSLM